MLKTEQWKQIGERYVAELQGKVKGSEPGTAPIEDDWGKSADSGSYRIDWGRFWRLEELALRRDLKFPAGERFDLEAVTTFDAPLVLIGEEGAGESSLRAWLQQRAKRRKKTLRLAERDLSAGEIADRDSAIDYLVSGIDEQRSPDEEEPPWRELRNVLQPLLKTTLLVMVRVDHVDHQLASRLLGQLRYAFESSGDGASLQGLALIMIGRDERAFDTEPFSNILPVCRVCRLPRFTVNETRLLLEKCRQQPIADELAVETQRITGGQPLLTQMLLQRLNAAHHTQDAGDPDLKKLYQNLRDYPPEVLPEWQARLARLVDDKRLHALVRDLVQGREYRIAGPSNESIPGYARALNLSGWLTHGQARDGDAQVWRFSDLHRHWARPVLRDPKRFLSRGALS